MNDVLDKVKFRLSEQVRIRVDQLKEGMPSDYAKYLCLISEIRILESIADIIDDEVSGVDED